MIEFCKGIAALDWEALASILTAGAAWTVAYLTYRIAKGYWKTNRQLEILKVRENWLVALRQAMSEYIAEGIVNEKSPESRKRFFSLHAKIILMLNPERIEKKTKLKNSDLTYYVSFDEIQTSMNAIGKRWADSKNVQGGMAELQILFHEYLKCHWDRLQEEVEK